jgi:hypothetical protein
VIHRGVWGFGGKTVKERDFSPKCTMQIDENFGKRAATLVADTPDVYDPTGLISRILGQVKDLSPETRNPLAGSSSDFRNV